MRKELSKFREAKLREYLLNTYYLLGNIISFNRHKLLTINIPEI